MPATQSPPRGLLQGASLFLDFDGTLVDIAERPDAVTVDRRLTELLARLAERLEGRVAVVSGRPAGEVRGLLDAGALTVVGSHGLEFLWENGKSSAEVRDPGLDKALAAMRGLASGMPGVLVEDKPLGAALHFRQAPDAEPACVALAVRLADDLGLQLQHGKMMVEVRAGGGDKGSAIRALMREPKFAVTRPVFMGDDVTDEPGFLAAQVAGGAGVLVGPERPTTAIYRLDGVADTLAWLEAECRASS